MQFKKYNYIENSYQQEFINSIIEQGFGELEYVVQEKIYGANVSFIADGKTVVAAKRTELILSDEKFFNSNVVQEKYTSNILNLFKELAENFNAKISV